MRFIFLLFSPRSVLQQVQSLVEPSYGDGSSDNSGNGDDHNGGGSEAAQAAAHVRVMSGDAAVAEAIRLSMLDDGVIDLT